MASDEAVEFVIPGEWTPERKRSYRAGKFTRRVDTEEAATFKQKAAVFAAQAMAGRTPFDEPLIAEVTWVTQKPASYRKHENVPWKRPDLDNLNKALQDGIDGIVMSDDAQIVDLHLRKQFGDREQVEVSIRPYYADWPYGD
jgi:Holliday junction resolvase RusA-like endonuclease